MQQSQVLSYSAKVKRAMEKNGCVTHRWVTRRLTKMRAWPTDGSRGSQVLRDRPLVQWLSAHAIGVGGLRFKSRVSQIVTVSPTAHHRSDVPSEQLCSLIA